MKNKDMKNKAKKPNVRGLFIKIMAIILVLLMLAGTAAIVISIIASAI